MDINIFFPNFGPLVVVDKRPLFLSEGFSTMWKTILTWVLPMVKAAGEAKKAEDANDTGRDDAIGVSLVYAADLLTAIINNKELPKAPDVLK